MKEVAVHVSRRRLARPLALLAMIAVSGACGGDGRALLEATSAAGAPRPASYVSVQTAHFDLLFPEGDEQYHEAVARFLERAYTLYQGYSGQDVNTLSGNVRYEFGYRADDWYWGSTRMGDYAGLSVAGGPSAVRSAYLAQSLLPTSASPNSFVSVTLHELGNGWWRMLDNTEGVSPLPWWFDDEGHSGFLRAVAELDMGYCAEAQEQHQAHYADSYVKCKESGGSHCGAEILLVSLQHKYGWGPFRRVYAAVQSGSLDRLLQKDELARNGAAAVILSEAVGESLVDFLAGEGIEVDEVSRLRLRRLPTAKVSILSELPCR